tara:strand:+ start:1832 stop:2047 length:216 start_codon:yes stop_codon:yes gene_type:complete
MNNETKQIKWKRDGEDYISKCGTYKIVKMQSCDNCYGNNIAWTLVDVDADFGIDVFDYLRSAKAEANLLTN